jgi:hypothetical protein
MKRVERVPHEGRPAPPVAAALPGVGTTMDGALALPSSKVKDWHKHRKAIVYIRQSTPQQVLEHRESASRQ